MIEVDTMGHATIYLPDEKRPLHEANERLMGKGDKSALPLYSYSDVVAQSKKSSWQQLKDYLPSVRDVVKLVLFFTVTVIGMTFIFEAFVNVAGNTVRYFHLCQFLAVDFATEASIWS